MGAVLADDRPEEVDMVVSIVPLLLLMLCCRKGFLRGELEVDMDSVVEYLGEDSNVCCNIRVDMLN